MKPVFLARMRACTACRLCEQRTQVVVGTGDESARLIILGEAPGRTEDEGGEPFRGRSGRLLFELLAEIGVTREDCFITNVVKCRPPNNRTPTKSEIESCRPWWEQQLSYFRASIVLTLGNTATQTVVGHREPMSGSHGNPVAIHGHVIVPSYHPAAALRGGNSVVAVMREDLDVVARLMKERA